MVVHWVLHILLHIPMLVIPLQAMMSGLNQQRNNFRQWRGGLSPEEHGSHLDPMTAANNPFCGTPRLVLGPDGQQLTLARKLKQQNPEVGTEPAVDINFLAHTQHVACSMSCMFILSGCKLRFGTGHGQNGQVDFHTTNV